MKPEGPRAICILACHYRNSEEVREFLRHVLGLPLPHGWNLYVGVSDNSGTWDHSVSLGNKAIIYSPGQNLGYLRGCAFALERWIAKYGGYPEWVAVTNTDVEFEEEFFHKLVLHPWPDNVGIVAPDIRLRNGMPQNPYKIVRPRRRRMYLYSLVYRNIVCTVLLEWLHAVKSVVRRYTWKEKTRAGASIDLRTIYAPHGAVLCFRPQFFHRGGSLDYPGFMYGEEIFIAEQARRLGLDVVWAPHLRAWHNEGAVTNRVSLIQRMRWKRDSIEHIWKEYFV